MMKSSGAVVIFCAALFHALTPVSTVQRLNSINDLKRIDFGGSVPRHSLVVLHWFAHITDIDNLMRLTFNPDEGDYGSHYYSNFEEILDPLPKNRYQYYTVGNINQNQNAIRQLPDHVVHPQDGRRNRVRIIIRVVEQSMGWYTSRMIDQVYITQHYQQQPNNGSYDSTHTYQVTTNLLRQIREFSMEENHWTLMNLRDRYGQDISDAQLRQIRVTWNGLACLGLLLLIVVQEMPQNPGYRLQATARRDTQDDFWDNFIRVVVVVFLVLFIVFLASLGRNYKT